MVDDVTIDVRAERITRTIRQRSGILAAALVNNDQEHLRFFQEMARVSVRQN